MAWSLFPRHRPASPACGSPESDRVLSHWGVVALEVALFLVALLLADHFWAAGDRFGYVEPHPFWILVVLLAAHYGTSEGLLAAAASTVALLAGNLPAQGFDENVHDYAWHLLLRPVLWMVAALVIGEIRASHRLHHAETAGRLAEAEQRMAELAAAHGHVAAARDRLETRLAGQLRTAAGVLEAARKLETLDPRQVLAGATDLLNAALDTRGFSLYLLKGDALVLVATDGASHGTRQLRYSAPVPLFEEIVGAQRYVTVATPDGERVLQGHGVMAGPLIDPSTGTIIGMLKVDEMRFIDFNLSSIQTFKAVCEWLAASYGNAQGHQTSQIEDQTTRLLGMKHLDRLVEYLRGVATRFDFDLTLLSFQVQASELPDAIRRQIPVLLGDAARSVLRRTDLVFSHQPPGSQFAVVLPGATPEAAVIVSQKLTEALHESCGWEVPCTMQVRAIWTVGDDPAFLRQAGPEALETHAV